MTPVLSGQTTVAAAGTEVVLVAAATRVNVAVAIRALSTNTGKMYIGNTGAGVVSSTTGYELSAGDQIILEQITDLSEIMVDASVSGEKVCWLILGSW
jgi:hypothetical protein